MLVRAAVEIVVVPVAVLVVLVVVGVVAVVPAVMVVMVVIAITVVFCEGSGCPNKRINPNKPLFGPGSKIQDSQAVSPRNLGSREESG